MTGLYPHRNGGLGFDPISTEVTTLQEVLHASGYMNGIIGKVMHLEPKPKYHWSFEYDMMDLGYGRDPLEFYRRTRQFLDAARAEQRPFFLMVNSHDPHRPFAGSADEMSDDYPWEKDFDVNWRREYGAPPRASRYYAPHEVSVPGFLPDIPDVRTEIAQYFSSVHRCDETVGKVLLALREKGFERDTVVMFLSDNGMAFPFAKANCYLTSSRTPLIVRWPGVVEPGRVDAEHLVAGVDFLPTILEILGLPAVPGIDGRSFAGLLSGVPDPARESLVTFFNITYKRDEYPMRGVIDRRFGYIFNKWADGQTLFRNESKNGLTFRAMQRAGTDDPAIAERVRFFDYRTAEELYDYDNDPAALHNLIADEEYRDVADGMREALLETMESTQDPQTAPFRALIGRTGS